MHIPPKAAAALFSLFLFAAGSNLGDEDARRHTSPLKDQVPLPGRSLSLGVRYDF